MELGILGEAVVPVPGKGMNMRVFNILPESKEMLKKWAGAFPRNTVVYLKELLMAKTGII